MRCLFLLLSAFWLIAAAPPPPPILLPYIHEGHFDPGDYGWMRGRFDDASPAEKAQGAAVRAWLDECFKAGLERTRTELIAMGIREPKIEQSDFRDLLCAEVASAPYPLSAGSFAEFQKAAAAARPVAESYLLATARAEQIAGPRGPTLADQLLARPVGEQMLRIAMTWGEGDMRDAPPLPPDAKAVLLARLVAATAARDHANTAWLKAIVEKQGWPTVAEVGEHASHEAWLLVQHADADPPFQLKVLRLMEPLAASGGVSKADYAYLYDRTMLKLTGKQRYATQATCRAGKRVPQPLEDEAAVATRRAEMGLNRLADYMAMMEKTFGPCPPDPPGPAPAKR